MPYPSPVTGRVVAVVAISLAAVVMFTAVLVFGIGWANRGTSASVAQVQVARVRACASVPVGSRDRCINPPASKWTVEQDVVDACEHVTDPNGCIVQVLSTTTITRDPHP